MASNTSRLNLLMKDPVADGNSTFNLKTMMNDNWQKIDDKVATIGADGKVEPGQLPDDLVTIEELNSAGATLQGELDSLEQTVAAHQTDLASQESGKGASLIGINDSGNLLTATTVEGALAEVMTKANSAFQSASDGKTLVANAITAKGQTASGSNTFAQLATAINNINTGKKWASGTIRVVNGTPLSISGLSFKPNKVIFNIKAQSGNVTSLHSIMSNDNDILYSGYFYNQIAYYRESSVIQAYVSSTAKFNADGFISGITFSTAMDINWIAFE